MTCALEGKHKGLRPACLGSIYRLELCRHRRERHDGGLAHSKEAARP